MTQPLLEIKDLTINFGGLVAVQRLDLIVNPGEIVGLIGPNGAGKTTFLKTALENLAPLGGEVIMGAQFQKSGMKVDSIAAPFQDHTAEIVVKQDPGNTLKVIKGAIVAAQKVCSADVIGARVGSSEIHFAPGSSVAYLPQDAGCEPGRTLHEEMLSLFADVMALEEEQRRLARMLSEIDRPSDVLGGLGKGMRAELDALLAQLARELRPGRR